MGLSGIAQLKAMRKTPRPKQRKSSRDPVGYRCDKCEGEGWIDGHECPKCHGVGKHSWGLNPEAYIFNRKRRRRKVKK